MEDNEVIIVENEENYNTEDALNFREMQANTL